MYNICSNNHNYIRVAIEMLQVGRTDRAGAQAPQARGRAGEASPRRVKYVLAADIDGPRLIRQTLVKRTNSWYEFEKRTSWYHHQVPYGRLLGNSTGRSPF